MKHLFVVNPAAGKMKLDEKLERVSQTIEVLPAALKRSDAFEIYVTRAPMDACARIREEAAAGNELRVYACGGDGTLNECVCGAAGFPNAAVTHYPCGTGNDFIKTFGEERERFRSLRELIEGEVHPVDLIDCNGRKSINICSVGIDARVGTDVHKYSGLPLIGGATGYVASLAVNYARGLSSRMTVTADGMTCGPELNMVCVCNGRYYGGGFNPSREARPDDGILDCFIVSGVTRLTFLPAILGYARGNYRRFPQYITHIRTTALSLRAAQSEVINLDGEAEYGRDIEFRLERNAIRFITPRDLAFFA